jgi:threonine/homoserine/homoserine lactone efflux protein
VIGIAIIIAESTFVFNTIKYLGAAYLIYLGVKGLMTKPQPKDALDGLMQISKPMFSPIAAIKKGFFVNLLNPKATLFFLSVFTQVIDPNTPTLIKSLYGFEFCLIGFLWFSFLSIILSNPILKRKLLSVQHYIEKTLGAFLILFGFKVALSL